MCSCRTRGGHSLTRTKGSPQRVSLCWAPRPSLQLVSRAGLSDPASMLTHSLDSSSSHPTLCLSQHQGRGTRISPGAGVGWRGVVTERLWRFGSLGAAGKAGSSIKPHQISGGKQPRGVHTVTAQLISIRCKALSASLTTCSVRQALPAFGNKPRKEGRPGELRWGQEMGSLSPFGVGLQAAAGGMGNVAARVG